MIKYTKFFITFLLAVTILEARSQSTATTSSPYSQYGLGELTPLLLPQNIAMGGIATATSVINGTNSVNPLNPSSYGDIYFTTIDAGLYFNTLFLSQTGQATQRNGNVRLSHLAFAIPITRGSALSFGLMPYSEMGYNYTQTLTRGFGTGSSVDTNRVNYIYSGEGGLSKAYIGYGFTVARHLRLGFNASYIFGDLKHYQSVEFPDYSTALNTRVEQDNSVGGLNYDYGVQYQFDLSISRHITIGYSASASSNINSKSSYIVSQYPLNISQGTDDVAVDTLINRQSVNSKIHLPQINHFGISYQKDQKYLVGADFSTGHWSDLSIGGTNSGMANSTTINLGGQYTPNANALGNYFATVDYRLGFVYDQTYFSIPNPTGGGNTQINSKAITFGVGMPLRPGNQSYSKLNFSAELGQRGTLSNGLVKENYINIHIGFTLNDKWFQRYKFD